MKILFLHAGDRVPSSRFRVLPFAPLIRKAGHQCTLLGSFPQMYDYFPWLGFRPSQFLKRLTRRAHLLWASFFKYDVIVLSREIFDTPSLDFEKKFRKLAKVFVLDVDDAVFQRYPEKFEQLAKMADLVIAGNHYLKEYIEQWNSNIVIIPTCVDLDEYQPIQEISCSAKKRCIIGWMGTSGNLPYLEVVAPALRELAKEVDFELRLIVDCIKPLNEIDLEGVKITHIVWKGKTATLELQNFDIGIMPLPDNQWCLYKCGFKLLQYMAAGIPAIASPVGVNSEIIDQGANGFLANDTTEWKEAFVRLIQNKPLCNSIGKAARKSVERKYAIEENCSLLLSALSSEVKKLQAM